MRSDAFMGSSTVSLSRPCQTPVQTSWFCPKSMLFLAGSRSTGALEYQVELELADGSEVSPCGLLRGVNWMFAASRRRVKCDFYVLKDLCTDVVLSNDFLFGYDVFFTQIDSLSEPSYSEEDPELLFISLKRNGRSELMQPEDPSNIDYTSANVFSRQRVLAELDRCDKFDE
ncbi:hypothetical protein BDP55DRAFT_341197 [Colletotrichum godetiae]|uniref:Uncharacterized protein n=1 Tax=Colletotrichum godetiae TaxID=1209918 RepID=A0AAJ0ATQ3_9PEZI|nr:uncharacterized protein BDP55DRAFT_341197 [Colletotrichum godetiae]KAK1690183.1 hypothetical protein BDP55DRAFT_341197 [Colletotrichum godetiae]